MNTIEERIRAATRAAADTVPPDSVPPLELPEGGPARFRWRHARSSGTARAAWLAPAAAATAMIVIAVSVVAVSRTTRTSAAAPEPTAAGPGSLTAGPPASSYVASGQVPPYYVAITSHGNPNLNPSYAVVQETVSGKTLATITPSVPGGTIVAVTAAADDRTFVLDEQHWVKPESSANQSFQARTFYLVRLSATGRPGPPEKLDMSVPAGAMMTGFALSPDGGRLAIAVEPNDVKNDLNLQEVRLYTLASGTEDTWSADGTIGSGPDDARSLSWTADGRTLAFDWTMAGPGVNVVVRLLGVSPAAAGRDLLAASRVAVTLVNQPAPAASVAPLFPPITPAAGQTGVTATATVSVPAAPSGSQPLARPSCQQDSIITPDGSAIVCAAVAVTNQQESTPTSGGVSLRRGAVTAFYEYSAVAGTLLRALGHWSFGNVGALAVDVLWSSPSGTVLIAVIPTAGDGRVGIISGNQFTPLKARSASVSPDSGTW